jgi:hypothetical protein
MRGGESLEKLHADVQSGQALFFDLFKHLTTLNTGSILVLTSLRNQILATASWRILVPIALCGFLASLVASLVFMFVVAFDRTRSGYVKPWINRVANHAIYAAGAGFLVGVVSLAVYATVNL